MRDRPLRIIAATVALIAAALLFVDGPSAESHRITLALWDLGHVALFAALAVLALALPAVRRWTVTTQCIALLLSAVLLGWLVEWLQLRWERSFALQDIAYDALGALLGWLRFNPKIPAGRRREAVVSVLATVVLLPSLLISVDTLTARYQFPVLLSFQSWFEPTRLTGTAQFPRWMHAGPLPVHFVPSETDNYARFSLTHFHGDWLGFQSLLIRLHSLEPEPFRMHCRIHDALHADHHYAPEDRYHIPVTVYPGDNVLLIDLDDVRRAPRGRSMRMGAIRDLSCYMRQPTRRYAMRLQRIELQAQ